MTTLQVELAPKLIPVFEGEADVRGSHGGRGSTKTRGFATMTAVRALMWAQAGVSGQILCTRELMNSLDDSSFAEIKGAILANPGLAPHFDMGEKYIRTAPHLPGRVDYTFAGLRHNIDSIKSKSRILLNWTDEAEGVSEAAWAKLMPTVREEGSEVWVTWNPERDGSATDKRFRKNPPDGAKIVEMNWRDNPWFGRTRLAKQRIEDKEKRPDSYEWIWEGAYATTHEGAYYDRLLNDAKRDGRIREAIPVDPVLPIYGFHDIGGSGARADAYSIWFVQFVDGFANIIDHHTAQGQVLGFHIAHVRRKWPQSIQFLPHDGVNENNVTGKRIEDHWRDGGFDVRVVPNQGKGAAMQRVEAVRRVLPKCRFVEGATKAGRQSLAWYHEKRPTDGRDVGLGPEHDWSSHDADAFGLMAIKFDELAAPRNTYTGPLSPDVGTMC